MISPMSSSARNHRDSGNTVKAETLFQCKPESSTVKMVGNNKILTARCRWNRSVSVPAEGQNSYDCVGNLCGSRVVYRNKATPTDAR